MSKWDARKQALALLDRHPGWSDRRVARLLGVSNSTLDRWRRDADFPLYRKRVRDVRRRSELLPLHTHPDDAGAAELRRLRERADA